MGSTPRSPARRGPDRQVGLAAALSPRRRDGAIRWNRVGRVALLLVLGVIVLLYIPPVTHWVEQSSTASHQREELDGLKLENRELEARLDELRGPAAIEREARSLGMVRLGERAIVVHGLPTD